MAHSRFIQTVLDNPGLWLIDDPGSPGTVYAVLSKGGVISGMAQGEEIDPGNFHTNSGGLRIWCEGDRITPGANPDPKFESHDPAGDLGRNAEAICRDKDDAFKASRYVSGALGYMVGAITDDSWQRMQAAAQVPCGKMNCHCHIMSTLAFESLEAFRDECAEHAAHRMVHEKR